MKTFFSILILWVTILSVKGQSIPTPTIMALGPTVTCNGDGVWLKSSAATGNHWSTGSQDTAIYAVTSGTYSVLQVLGTNTSAPSAPITVSVFPAATLFPLGPVCSDVDSIQLSVNPQGGIFKGMGAVKANYFYPPLVGVNSSQVVTYYTSYFINADICSDSASIRIMVLDCTGFTEQTNKEELIVSPNPSPDLFYINQGNNGISVLYIRDLNDHEIESRFFKQNGLIAIQLLAPAGVYILTVNSENQMRRLKLVKL